MLRKVYVNILFVLHNTEHSHGYEKPEFITVNVSRFKSLILYQISSTNERHLTALYSPYRYKCSTSNELGTSYDQQNFFSKIEL